MRPLAPAPTLVLVLVLVATSTRLAFADDHPASSSPTADRLDEIEVTATRRAAPSFEKPHATDVITERRIDERQVRFAPDALREAPGVMVQQTAYGQGSPFVRGLTGNQVLILVDGVRLNNSTFRFGANQYLATIDPFSIGRVEVLRGPGSTLYGSDALGGVVQVFTREREDRSRAYDVGGELVARYGSASKELTGRAGLEGNAGGLGFVGGVTHSDFDDLRGGRHTGVQPNTGYRSFAGDLKVAYAFGPHEVSVAHQHVTQHDVPRADRLNLALPGRTPANLLLDFDPQRRDLTYVAYAFEDPASAVTGVRSNVSFQRQLEARQEITAAQPTRLTKDEDWVETWGTSHQLSLQEIALQNLTFGLEHYGDHVSSRRERVTLTTGVTQRGLRPRFADGGGYEQTAVFVQDEVNLVPDRVKLIVGGRYTHVGISGEFADPATGPVSLDRSIDALTGSGHFWLSPIEEVALVGGVAQGFRAPNFDDLSVFGQVGQGFEVPNPDADPERSIAYEVGAKWRVPGPDPLLVGSLFFHWTEYKDLLQRTQGELNGLGFIDANGNGTQDANEQLVLQRRNIGEAVIYGIEADARLRLPKTVTLAGERWSILGHAFWTYGDNQTDRQPVRGIPPFMGLAGVRCESADGRLWAEATGSFARFQERIAPADLTDPRIPPGGTPGYEVYSLRGGARVTVFKGQALRAGDEVKDYDAEIAVGVENILDRDYRVHGSGVNGAGTSFVGTVGLKF